MNRIGNETSLGSRQWRTIVETALRDVSTQAQLPDSPCAPMQGRMLWCAGALIVRAALRVLRSPAAARAFERALVRTGDKRLIVATATAIGLPTEIVARAVVQNDRFHRSQRVERVVRFLQALRHHSSRITDRRRVSNLAHA